MPNKLPHEMSLSELKAAADAEELEYYRQRANKNPNDAAAQETYRNICLLRGLDPDTGKELRFNKMTTEEIGREWNEKGAAIEAKALDDYRSQQADIWLASQPAYRANPTDGPKICAELDRLGLKGSAYDLQHCWESLVQRGEIKPVPLPPTPIKFHSAEELRALPLEQLKRLAEEVSV